MQEKRRHALQQMFWHPKASKLSEFTLVVSVGSHQHWTVTN